MGKHVDEMRATDQTSYSKLMSSIIRKPRHKSDKPVITNERIVTDALFDYNRELFHGYMDFYYGKDVEFTHR